jgi:hypothetical protein
MLEILKNLLGGALFDGLLKLFGGLFGNSESSDNQQDTNGDSSSQDNPLPSNEPNQQGGTTSPTANEDFNLDDIWKKVEDIFGGGSNSNEPSEPEKGEIEPPTEPEMEPDEPEIEPKQPHSSPKVEPTPPNQPEPISASEPEAQPMPSAQELEEASKSLGKEADNVVASDESLGFEPETQANKRLGSNSKPTNEEESLGFESETKRNHPTTFKPQKPKEDESLGFAKE